MKLTNTVHVVPVPRQAQEGASQFHPTLILDENEGPTLVDASFPEQADDISAGLTEAGVELGDLQRVIITHQDLDHTGSAAEIVRRSGARVFAHPEDIPYIDGTRRPFKPSPEILQERPHMREVFESLEPVGVDEHLEDGFRLDISGGVRVVFTPGHTPGHISLYLEAERVLIAGDALTAEDGVLKGPNPAVTLDMPRAVESLRKLVKLELRSVVCYHGGVITESPREQLQRVLEELS